MRVVGMWASGRRALTRQSPIKNGVPELSSDTPQIQSFINIYISWLWLCALLWWFFSF